MSWYTALCLNRQTETNDRILVSQGSIIGCLQYLGAYNKAEYSGMLVEYHIGYLRKKIRSAMNAFNAKGTWQVSFACGDVVRMAAIVTKGVKAWSGPFLVLGVSAPKYGLRGFMRTCAK